MVRILSTLLRPDGGRIVAEGTTAELKARVAGQCLDLTLAGPAEFTEAGRRLGDRATHRDPSALTLGVPTDGTPAAVRALPDEIDPERALIGAFAVRATSLGRVLTAAPFAATVRSVPGPPGASPA